MRRCLDIQDIFSVILNHLASQGNRSELARLARVSRQLSDQVLNVLWKEDVPLVALLKILPHDLWKIDPIAGQDGWGGLSPEPTRFKIRRLVEPTDWTPRFLYYSAKIKNYDQRHEDITIDPNVYKAFFLYLPRRHLLPNLNSITFSADREDKNFRKYRNSIPFFASLLNPNIESVYFDHIPEAVNEFDFAIFLSTITKHCPVVKKLNFFGDCNAGKQLAVLGSFYAWPHLQHLSFREGSITSEIFTEASKLPGLLSLHIDLPHDDDADFEDDAQMAQNQIHLTDTSHEPFPQLREVSFRTPFWEVAESIVGYFICPLQALSLFVYDEEYSPYDSHGSTFTALIGTITRNPHLSWSLRKLHIDGSPDMSKDPAFDEDSVDRALEGLFGLQSLEELSLACCGLEQLTDAWLAKASTFWPNMRDFSVEGNYDEPSDVKFTLGGIMPLVQRWKALDRIKLSLIWGLFSPEEYISNRAIASLTPGRGSYIRLQVQDDIHDIMQDIHLFVLISALFILFPRLAHINLSEIENVDRNWVVVAHSVAEVALQS